MKSHSTYHRSSNEHQKPRAIIPYLVIAGPILVIGCFFAAPHGQAVSFSLAAILFTLVLWLYAFILLVKPRLSTIVLFIGALLVIMPISKLLSPAIERKTNPVLKAFGKLPAESGKTLSLIPVLFQTGETEAIVFAELTDSKFIQLDKSAGEYFGGASRFRKVKTGEIVFHREHRQGFCNADYSIGLIFSSDKTPHFGRRHNG